MVLGLVADLIASVVTILFPIFASYKALQTSDPAQLSPWLMYWVVLSLILLAESYTVFLLGWLPFYSWIRLLLLSYLVLPQTQGAKMLYQEHISPFISTHEHEIESFISNAHERAAALGLKYLKQAIELFREKVLGLPPRAPEAPPPEVTATTSYAQSLLSRFSIPSARPPATDIYGMLSSAVAAATGSSAQGKTRDAQMDELSASGTLFPKEMNSPTEKISYIAQQREKLGFLLSALDREQKNLGGASEKEIEADVDRRMGGLDREGLKKNRSEHSFEAIDPEEAATAGREKEKEESRRTSKRTSSGGWGAWFGGGDGTADAKAGKEAEKGTSSGFEPQG